MAELPTVASVGRKRSLLALGLIVTTLGTCGVFYAYRVRREPESELQEYLRNTASCCTPHQLRQFNGQSSALPAVYEMLANPLDEPHWRNDLTALGILSHYNENLARHLLQFVCTADTPDTIGRAHKLILGVSERNEPSDVGISDGLVEAKLGALKAVGYLLSQAAAKNATPVSLETLVEGTSPAYWQRCVRWKSEPHFADDEERNAALAAESIRALAITNLPAARNHILEMRGQLRNDQPLLREALDQAVCYMGLEDCSVRP